MIKEILMLEVLAKEVEDEVYLKIRGLVKKDLIRVERIGKKVLRIKMTDFLEGLTKVGGVEEHLIQVGGVVEALSQVVGAEVLT